MIHKDIIVIGAGQSGLAISYYLKKQNKDYLVLDANNEVGAPWLKRWNSLRLFTPSEFNNLPGFDFPLKKGHYANKYEVANYLKSYVEEFEIPIIFNQRVSALKKENNLFTLKTDTDTFTAEKVIIGTGPFHTPFTPRFHTKINTNIRQIHSENYKSPNQLQDGPTVVVGAGDSGVQILKEVSETGRKVYFSGNTNIGTMPQEFLGKTLWWWFDKLGVLRVNKYSWLGKKLNKGVQPVIGTDVKALFAKENIHCIGRCLDAEEDRISFAKATPKDIKNIVWATGFKPNFHWIEGITFDKDNYPNNFRGVSKDIEGLYFIGLPWMHTRGSATLGGVVNDAEYLNEYIFS